MHVLILRPYRKDNIYFRTIEEREKISGLMMVWGLNQLIMCFVFSHILRFSLIFMNMQIK